MRPAALIRYTTKSRTVLSNVVSLRPTAAIAFVASPAMLRPAVSASSASVMAASCAAIADWRHRHQLCVFCEFKLHAVHEYFGWWFRHGGELRGLRSRKDRHLLRVSA